VVAGRDARENVNVQTLKAEGEETESKRGEKEGTKEKEGGSLNHEY